MKYEELAKKAIEAKEKAVPTYSKFHVGAALLTEDDEVIIGGNIESASYGLTICAERTAVFTAVIEGKRKFKALAIASDAEGFTSPCGACRQVMLDQCGHDLDVVLVNKKNELKIYKLKELIPHSFDDSELR
ncbi:MAG: cytidine deaminase [Melioribacteraceae bacterium]|nr:cytidine deaminase [Melioribacteraceae bacterium]